MQGHTAAAFIVLVPCTVLYMQSFGHWETREGIQRPDGPETRI